MGFKIFRKFRRQPKLSKRRVYVRNKRFSGEPITESQTFPINKIVTSKYTVYNFLFKNLFEQFRRVANFYFLCVVIIQSLISDSPVSPATSAVPLAFVVVVTALKQGYEDFLRHNSDNLVNNRLCWVMKSGELVHLKSRDIQVGDIVKVCADEESPCDLVLLSSSNPDGFCHITTANLDGETNLKIHECSEYSFEYNTPEKLKDFVAVIDCDKPTPDLYKFNGKMTVYTKARSKFCSLNTLNLLLKGASLKNTTYIFGCAIYTGRDAKLSLNLKFTSNKFSTVERSMNRFLVIYLLVLVVTSFIGVILHHVYAKSENIKNAWYIKSKTPGNTFRSVVSDFLSFGVLFNYVIPISLYVTLELVKFIGSKFFSWDNELRNEVTGEYAKCNTSDLNEELGQVEYLFTDKTGTLTENEMMFRYCTVNNVKYEEKGGELCAVDMSEADSDAHRVYLEHFLLVLTLCNTVEICPNESQDEVTTTPKDQSICYSTSSPDEKALVEACARCGIILVETSGNQCTIETNEGVRVYNKLAILEFSPERRRMSAVVQDEEGCIFLLCKGGDTAVLNRSVSGNLTDVRQQVQTYSMGGLRCLVIAEKSMSEEEYLKLEHDFRVARCSLTDREELINIVFDNVEQNLHVLGVTAVEDRLQKDVAVTMESLREAGIKIWVLTGDHPETAQNVSYACGHIKSNMVKFDVLKETNSDQCFLALKNIESRITEEFLENFAIVLDGQSLTFILQEYPDLLYTVCVNCSAVVCCRMSPLQKSQIVELMKHSKLHPITAAIGDGANDVSMIQEAHVGIGIMGKEGRQAMRCSDFAVSKFHLLRRVFLVHGQYFYVRVTTLVQYFFYKNVAFVGSQFIFIFFNGFTPTPVYDSVFLVVYNILFTSLPILIYGITEKHETEENLLKYPEQYRLLSRNQRLKVTQFLTWALEGLWHSSVFFIGIYHLWNQNDVLMQNGTTNGIEMFGTVIFHIVVVTVNLRLALHAKYWTLMFVASLLMSIIGFIAFALTYSSVNWSHLFNKHHNSLYYVYINTLSSGSVWLLTLILIVIALMPDVILILVETTRLRSSKKMDSRQFFSQS